MTTIYDVSLPVHLAMVTWPGQPTVTLSHLSHQGKGDRATVSYLGMSVHTGTHVDATSHFLPHGTGVEQLDLNTLIGPAQVVSAPDVDALSAEVLAGLGVSPDTERLIVRTRNSTLWTQDVTAFQTDYVGVTPSGAQWLVEQGIHMIGVDYLSVAPFSDLATPHEILLSAQITIVEGLDLSAISPGMYQFVCLPLKLAGRDGAPARAVLIAD